MSEKSRREQKLLGLIMGILVVTVTYIWARDSVLLVIFAMIYASVIIIVILKELLDEFAERITTRRATLLKTFNEPYQPDGTNSDLFRFQNILTTTYISMQTRKTFERCKTDDELCNSIEREECGGCPANIPDNIFDALYQEDKIKNEETGRQKQ